MKNKQYFIDNGYSEEEAEELENFYKLDDYDPLKDEDIDVDKLGKDIYNTIIKVLKRYCDLREEYYNIIALWILGTHIHKQFLSYPYLFFHAMRGSGKTRLLKLVSHLVKNGDMIASMNEAVLFRIANNTTFCIDEFEKVASKEKSALRELLNAAYKKGTAVKRLKKVQAKDGEKYEVETFDIFCPIAMANIWGMEEVLSDRCITLTLEKSTNRNITRLLELYDIDEDINYLKKNIPIWCSLCNVVIKKNIYTEWNNYITNNYINTHNTYTTNTTQTTYNLPLLKILGDSNLDSRELELFFPLTLISYGISEKILHKTIETAEMIVKEKKAEDVVENRDVNLIDFVSKIDGGDDHIPISVLVQSFREFVGEDEKSTWLNSRWLGRALKRLSLVIEKRRVTKGIEVRLNYKKAKEKILLFKEVDSVPEKEIKIEKVE
jgi:hypothetical protein